MDGRRALDDRRAEAPKGSEAGRKVRTPQGSAPGNARSGQLEGLVAQKIYRLSSVAKAGGAGKGEKVR